VEISTTLGLLTSTFAGQHPRSQPPTILPETWPKVERFLMQIYTDLAKKIYFLIKNEILATKRTFLAPKYLSLNEIRSNFVARSGVIHGKGNAS
jgi:hypothetical protein